MFGERSDSSAHKNNSTENIKHSRNSEIIARFFFLYQQFSYSRHVSADLFPLRSFAVKTQTLSRARYYGKFKQIIFLQHFIDSKSTRREREICGKLLLILERIQIVIDTLLSSSLLAGKKRRWHTHMMTMVNIVNWILKHALVRARIMSTNFWKSLNFPHRHTSSKFNVTLIKISTIHASVFSFFFHSTI